MRFPAFKEFASNLELTCVFWGDPSALPLPKGKPSMRHKTIQKRFCNFFHYLC